MLRCFTPAFSVIRLPLFAIVLAVGASASAHASVLYNNYNPSIGSYAGLFDQGYSDTVYGTGYNVYEGSTFTLTSTSTITNLSFVGSTNSIDAYDWYIFPASDANYFGPINTAVLGSGSNEANTVGGSYYSGYIIDLAVNDLTLQAGNYIVLFHDTSTSTPFQDIRETTTGEGVTAFTGPDYNGYISNSTGGSAAIEVDGSLAATPLPATLPLFAGGLGFVGYLTGRKKRKSGQALAAA